MIEESLKEILSNKKSGDFEKIVRHTITQEDIIDFHCLYDEIIALEKNYHQMILGRKDVAKELIEKLKLLEEMSKLITRGIEDKKSHYEKFAREFPNINVSHYHKILEVLQKLASNESIEYEIKTLNYPSSYNSDRYGYRTTEEYTEEITILAEKKSLSKFDSSKKLPYLPQKMLEEIYEQGFSMILVGNDEYRTKRLNLPNMQTLGIYQPLVFYLQDDNLAIATSSLTHFIEENGSDFEKMDINELVEMIKTKYQKVKKLVK